MVQLDGAVSTQMNRNDAGAGFNHGLLGHNDPIGYRVLDIFIWLYNTLNIGANRATYQGGGLVGHSVKIPINFPALNEVSTSGRPKGSWLIAIGRGKIKWRIVSANWWGVLYLWKYWRIGSPWLGISHRRPVHDASRKKGHDIKMWGLL